MCQYDLENRLDYSYFPVSVIPMSMSTQQNMRLAVQSADILYGERVIMSSTSLPNEPE